MTEEQEMQAYKIMARKMGTGIRVQQQDLTGRTITDHAQAMAAAQSLAEAQSLRTRETWNPEVELYTVGAKPKLTR